MCNDFKKKNKWRGHTRRLLLALLIVTLAHTHSSPLKIVLRLHPGHGYGGRTVGTESLYPLQLQMCYQPLPGFV